MGALAQLITALAYFVIALGTVYGIWQNSKHGKALAKVQEQTNGMQAQLQRASFNDGVAQEKFDESARHQQ